MTGERLFRATSNFDHQFSAQIKWPFGRQNRMSQRTSVANLNQPLSGEEIAELDEFLNSEETSMETMSIDALDGYLTAIVVGPTNLSFNQWFSGIWGPSKDDAPHFKTTAHAQHIFDLIIRQMNGIIAELEESPDHIMPIFDTRVYQNDNYEYVDGDMWAYGFLQGVNLCRNDWQSLFNDENGIRALRPIILLGEDDLSEEEIALTETPKQREALTIEIPASISWIYQFWLPYRHAMAERALAKAAERSQPKIGRNDPCPCGSGKKIKKCCGTTLTLH